MDNPRIAGGLLQLGICVAVVLLAAGAKAGERLDRLRVLGPEVPRAYFFRASEGFAARKNLPYARWEETFERLMGIEGKVLEEEVPGRSVRNIDFFTRFKRQHPNQLVLLHYNGNARDPRDNRGRFFAGHWVYYNGCTITADLPAEAGETDIRVEDPRLFRIGIGRYRESNEDVGLCLLDAQGRPDWSASEQVQLVSVDAKRKILRIRRGCYGTKPRAFRAGKSYAAAHMSEGPWGRRSHLLWYYNYAPCCPKDAEGRTCADVLVADLAQRFSAEGELAAFDGVEFDVLHHEHFGGRPYRGGRGGDFNADGKGDNAILNGVNVYGVGVIEFCRQLRERLGEDRLMLADGGTHRAQRAFGILNGIESEGWPWLGDWEMRDWSGGLNRHLYWRDHGRRPVFNYINHKFTTAGPTPGSRRRPDIPFRVHRLVLAVAQCVDAAVCYSTPPKVEPGERFGIWDELRMGTEHTLGWLGKPLGPNVRLATRTPDTLGGSGRRMTPEFLGRFHGKDVRFERSNSGIQVRATDPNAPQLRFVVRDVPCNGPDLAVFVTTRGAPMKAYPREAARLTWVGVAPPECMFVRPDLPEAGLAIRGKKERPMDRSTGAGLRYFPHRTLGEETYAAYLAHPPYRGGVGYTFWHRDVEVPQHARLQFRTGMGEKAPERSDGVVFRVLIARLDGENAGEFTEIFRTSQVASRWVSHEVSLERWAGKRVRLKFITDCGPKDNSTTDHAHWADVWVLGPEGPNAHTQPVRHMTWTGEEAFTSGFYFPRIKSPRVTLEFRVEGSEPVEIARITAHAHPDAIVRGFEHGAVLANPAEHPYTFDLAKLWPGRRFRRLKGSSRQDPKANDGSPVAGTLTLQAKEGLFLARRED